MILQRNYFTFIFVTCIVHSCGAIWVTTTLSAEEVGKIFLSARDQGRSNAELMYRWNEEMKGDLCRNVLSSDPIVEMNIEHVDEIYETNRRIMDPALLERYFAPADVMTSNQQGDARSESNLVPVYPVVPKNIIVLDKFYEVFGFPCLAIVNDEIEEIYIADGYLERTLTILKTLENESEEETLSVIGFIELPPEGQLAADQRTVEESYFVSLSALQVKSFLCWDEDESLINPISTLSDNEKVKLCSLVYDTIRPNVDGWAAGVRFKTTDFEHGPVTFIALEKNPPKLRGHYRVVRGIECIEADGQSENILFILVPNWQQRKDTFVLTYSDEKAPVEMTVEVPSSEDQRELPCVPEKKQGASTSRKRKSRSREKKVSRPFKQQKRSDKVVAKQANIVTTTTVTQKAVVLNSVVEGVSFLVNRENGIRIAI